MAKRADYLKRFKAIKPYVTFKLAERTLSSRRLTLKQKRKITKYYNEVAALKNRPHKVYNSKVPSRRLKAQEYAGQNPSKFPELKTAFIPIGLDDKVSVKFKKGKIYVEEKHIVSTEILFNKKSLINDPIGHTEEKIAGSKAKGFNIMAGRYEIPIGYDRNSLPGAIARYVSDGRYATKTVTRQGKKVKNHNYVGDWLLGVRAHTFKKQSTFSQYIGAKKRAIEAAKRKRKAQRRKKK